MVLVPNSRLSEIACVRSFPFFLCEKGSDVVLTRSASNKPRQDHEPVLMAVKAVEDDL